VALQPRVTVEEEVKLGGVADAGVHPTVPGRQLPDLSWLCHASAGNRRVLWLRPTGTNVIGGSSTPPPGQSKLLQQHTSEKACHADK